MARPPISGQVKTRIASELGNEIALQVYVRLLEHTISVVKSLDISTDIHVTSLHDFFKSQGLNQVLQFGNDLGERMFNAFNHGFSNRQSQVVMIGTDCPGIQPQHIEEAYRLLKYVDVVIGPANDGGYYLIGMKKPHIELLDNMPWSTSHLLECTIRSMRNLNLSFATIQMLCDVDTPRDIPESWNMRGIIAKSS